MCCQLKIRHEDLVLGKSDLRTVSYHNLHCLIFKYIETTRIASVIICFILICFFSETTEIVMSVKQARAIVGSLMFVCTSCRQEYQFYLNVLNSMATSL